MNKDLKFIKKHYGEKFARFCRDNFSTALEHEGLLTKIILGTFVPTHSLYDDLRETDCGIDDFKSYISNVINSYLCPTVSHATKSPEELLDEAGYILYPECKTEEDIQSFKKYYASGEEICTFRGGRLNTCRVWFAVKKNVDEINRQDFTEPKRQDKYGTSVISIQFTKSVPNTLSIKNRYNHKVDNPDSTFSNDLENIIAGLSEAFVKKFSLITNTSSLFSAPSQYVLANNGVYYRNNVEVRNIYFCENNIAIMYNRQFGNIFHVDKSRYILMENYVVDLQQKRIFLFDFEVKKDSFIKSLGEIEDLKVVKLENGERLIVVSAKNREDVEITIGKHNEIIGLKNNNVTEVGDDFLRYNIQLERLEMNNLVSCGDNFLFGNKMIKKLYLPKLKKVCCNFLFYNEILEELQTEELETALSSFLFHNLKLKEIHLDKLFKIGEYFMHENEVLKKASFNNLYRIAGSFMSKNISLEEIYLSNCEEIGNYFLSLNNSLKKIDLDNVKTIGIHFLSNNRVLTEISLKNIKQCYMSSFLMFNENPFVIELKNYLVKTKKAKREIIF